MDPSAAPGRSLFPTRQINLGSHGALQFETLELARTHASPVPAGGHAQLQIKKRFCKTPEIQLYCSATSREILLNGRRAYGEKGPRGAAVDGCCVVLRNLVLGNPDMVHHPHVVAAFGVYSLS
jgi:hypothetical protein